MLKKLICVTLLTACLPARAATDIPDFSGNYSYIRDIVCWSQTNGQYFTQEVGLEKFVPKRGYGRVTDSQNYITAGNVHNQGAARLREPYKVIGIHRMNLGGMDSYVQFGTVVNGIATSAVVLGSNDACSFRTVFTQIQP
ncbi:MAG: hypothetical protein JO261_11010 [Alphaproteobacteria bacterium]|nr:hypothetical protein [Alphaproteobacteria bacterium]MBV9694216.1 hypothetical protein [Alphaproteobacteria bacterium]